MTELYRMAKTYKGCDIKKWLENRKANAICKIDIEALFEIDNRDEVIDCDEALDELLAIHGVERVMYLLYITKDAKPNQMYDAAELKWINDMADIHELYWKDPNENGSDYQYDYALSVRNVADWNRVVRTLRERQEETESGKIYILCEANNCNMDITVSKPFARRRDAWKHMQAVYQELMRQDADEGSISEWGFSVYYGRGRDIDCYYGDLKEIDLKEIKK